MGDRGPTGESITGPTGPVGPTGPTGGSEKFKANSVLVSFSPYTATGIATATGDTGLSTANPIWLNGYEPPLMSATGVFNNAFVLSVNFSSNYGPNWHAEMSVFAYSDKPSDFYYYITYFTK